MADIAVLWSELLSTVRSPSKIRNRRMPKKFASQKPLHGFTQTQPARSQLLRGSFLSIRFDLARRDVDPCRSRLAEFQFGILAAVWHSVTFLEKVGSKSMSDTYHEPLAKLSLQKNRRHVWCTIWQFVRLRITKCQGMCSVENRIATFWKRWLGDSSIPYPVPTATSNVFPNLRVLAGLGNSCLDYISRSDVPNSPLTTTTWAQKRLKGSRE